MRIPIAVTVPLLYVGGLVSTLSGQSLTFVNHSNSALGSDLISADQFLLTITGAGLNKPVTHSETKNGVLTTPTPLYVGTTNANGDFALTGTEFDYHVSAYTQQCHVDGAPIGPLQEFEVIYKPNSLTVMGVAVTSLPAQCINQNLTYGIFVDISYQVKTMNGMAVTSSTGVPLIPIEDVKFQNDPWLYGREIGPDPGCPTSSRFLDDAGQFHDVPVGACANYSFSYPTRQIILHQGRQQ